MTLKTDNPFETDPPVFFLKDRTTRAQEKHEQALPGSFLEQSHSLGDYPSGRQLLQVVEYQGHSVGLLDWRPGCWKLVKQETHIRWTHERKPWLSGAKSPFRRYSGKKSECPSWPHVH